MSKVFLRLLVVIILIAGITTAVYFIINQPDENKKLYEDYASLVKTEKYQNFDYLTKEWVNSGTGTPISLVKNDQTLNTHYKLATAIKNQIESNLLLINYAKDVDKTAQKSIAKKIDNFNKKAYGKDGVSYQAKYLYTYYVNENDASNITYLTQRLQVAMHEMELAGTEVLAELSIYVAKNVYNGSRPEDLKYVLNDSLALIASAITSYQNTNANSDELNSHLAKYQNYLTKFETYVNNGELNGYNSLGDMSNYVELFNSVDRSKVYGMLTAENFVQYLNSQNAEDKANLLAIHNFMEGTL